MDWNWLTEIFSKEGDWWARIPAAAGLALSVVALWKGRTSLKLHLGFIGSDDIVSISNLSPHAVEITSIGVVRADGSLSDWSDGPDPWPGLPRRLESRSECTITLHEELAPFSASHKKYSGRGGCFVRIAGGRAFSNPGKVRRGWWWMRSQIERLFSKRGRKVVQE